MTRKEALRTLEEVVNFCDVSIREELTAEMSDKLDEALSIVHEIRDSFSRPRDTAADKEKRKTARAEAVKGILPVLTQAVIDNPNSTAKEIFALCADQLPADWNASKTQYALLNDLSPIVGKNEVKGKPNTYYFIQK